MAPAPGSFGRATWRSWRAFPTIRWFAARAAALVSPPCPRPFPRARARHPLHAAVAAPTLLELFVAFSIDLALRLRRCAGLVAPHAGRGAQVDDARGVQRRLCAVPVSARPQHRQSLGRVRPAHPRHARRGGGVARACSGRRSRSSRCSACCMRASARSRRCSACWSGVAAAAAGLVIGTCVKMAQPLFDGSHRPGAVDRACDLRGDRGVALAALLGAGRAVPLSIAIAWWVRR